MTDDEHIPTPALPADEFSEAEALRALRIPFGDADAQTMLESIRAANRRDRKRYAEWRRNNERRKAAGLPLVDPPVPESFWSSGALVMLSRFGEPEWQQGDGPLADARAFSTRPDVVLAHDHQGDSPQA